MLVKSFDLGLTYSLIAVFNVGLERPLNDWSDQHAYQGFTWRPGSVSFGMLNLCTRPTIEVRISKEANLRADAVRAILIPFSVTSEQGIAFQDVSGGENDNIVSIPQGNYALMVETGFRDEFRSDPKYQGRLVVLLPIWCRFTFVPKESVQAEILRVDSNLSPTHPLLMEADPA